MAIFTDDSYLTVAGDNFAVTVPNNIYVGIVLDEGDFMVQAQKCWLTPDNNVQNPLQYIIIENGCPAEVNLLIFSCDLYLKAF
jgi:hypothetical protein